MTDLDSPAAGTPVEVARHADGPHAEIAAEVHRIVLAQLGLAAPPEGDELAARLDSVQRMSLVVAIEDHFQVCFSPEDDERARSLNDLVAIVQEHLLAASG